MKAITDPDHALDRGLQAIRTQYDVTQDFPPQVIAAAEAAIRRTPTSHADRTALDFRTLDPAQSTDLDQAFLIEEAGADLILRYAIADVAWFVDDGDALDIEAWKRGTSFYLPDGKAPLYPTILSEGAASLLPDGPRPAVIFVVRVAPDGGARLDGVERAIIRSRAKLGYETLKPGDLPPLFDSFARRIRDAELRRGAARVDPPEQEVVALPDGGHVLGFRQRFPAEEGNAAMSLATNLAVAEALLEHRTGLFRVMAEPDAQAVARLRHSAAGLGLAWPREMTLAQFEARLDPADTRAAALMLEIRRAGEGARYTPYHPGVVPWHAAMAGTYAHATAPLRRLADRYVARAALEVANGRPVPGGVSAAFEKLPQIMAKADAREGQIDRAVVDLAEAVMLGGREGERFSAIVTDLDERGARIQLADLAVVARVAAPGAIPGDRIEVRLAAADAARREIRFEPAA
ncbi:RNB domain-containing ribonuclease [Novosphingobium tardum]|uniref:RNB domain-containing ribonuclease n=1 Tax=Novosphingobium tardum TaxID=1538021 RepID=A0ABV8RMJ4_9SPHN